MPDYNLSQFPSVSIITIPEGVLDIGKVVIQVHAGGITSNPKIQDFGQWIIDNKAAIASDLP